MNIVHCSQLELHCFPTVFQQDSPPLERSENKKQTDRYKIDKTFLSLTAHQSYILIYDNRHYVQIRVPCVKTDMTEYSTDSLANSLPRPSNSSSTEAGSHSATTDVIFSPLRHEELLPRTVPTDPNALSTQPTCKLNVYEEQLTKLLRAF